MFLDSAHPSSVVTVPPLLKSILMLISHGLEPGKERSRRLGKKGILKTVYLPSSLSWENQETAQVDRAKERN